MDNRRIVLRLERVLDSYHCCTQHLDQHPYGLKRQAYSGLLIELHLKMLFLQLLKKHTYKTRNS